MNDEIRMSNQCQMTECQMRFVISYSILFRHLDFGIRY